MNLFLKLMTTLLLTTCVSMAQTRVITHVTRAGGLFSTQIILNNGSDTSGQLVMTPYLEDGSPVEDVMVDLTAGQALRSDIEDLFGRSDISHVGLSGSEDIQAIVAYAYREGGTSSAHVLETGRTSQRWRIFPGEGIDVSDGIAVLNIQEQPQTIVVQQFSQDDILIDQAPIGVDRLAPMAKGLFLFDSTFERQEGSYFEIVSEAPTSLMALRFASDSDYFWETGVASLPMAAKAESGVQVGDVTELTTHFHQVSGKVTVVAPNRLRFEQFHYDGTGPAVYIFLAKDAQFEMGFPVGEMFDTTVYMGEDFEVELPNSVQLEDFNSVSIWCEAVSADFGSGIFQSPWQAP